MGHYVCSHLICLQEYYEDIRKKEIMSNKLFGEIKLARYVIMYQCVLKRRYFWAYGMQLSCQIQASTSSINIIEFEVIVILLINKRIKWTIKLGGYVL